MKLNEVLTEAKTWLSVDAALQEWQASRRTMGCVAATDWWCKRVQGFKPERLTSYTKEGELYQHVVATNGRVRIDLAPYADKPQPQT